MNHWIHPGWVISKANGRRYYIDTVSLIRLNGLDPDTARQWHLGCRAEPGDRHYYPDPYGNYPHYFEE